MSKILKHLAFFLLLSNYSLADVTGKALSKVSEKISEKVLSIIPGEGGVTEFDIELTYLANLNSYILKARHQAPTLKV